MTPYSFQASGNPAPSTDSDYPSVALLLHAAGTNGATTQTDTSRYGRGLNRVGTATIVTSQSRFASVGSSMTFNGTSEAWTTDASVLWVGSGNFTLSGSTRVAGVGPSNQACISNYGAAGARGIELLVTPTGALSVRWSTDGTNDAGSAASAAGVVTSATWFDWEVVRSGSTIYIFKDGAQVASSAISGTIFSPRTPTNIGRTPDVAGAFWLGGHQAEIRVTLGVARHTSGFTPYTTPYADTGGTLTTIYETWGNAFNFTKSSGDTVVSEATTSDIAATGLFSVDHDWYCEILCAATGTFDAAVGVRRNDQLNNVNFATGQTVSVRAAGTTFVGSTGATAGTGTSYANGDRLMLAWQRSSGKLFVGKNGTWMNSGNPAAGTGALFSGLTGDGWLPFVGGDNGTGNHTFTANFGASAFTYSVPSGYAAITA